MSAVRIKWPGSPPQRAMEACAPLASRHAGSSGKRGAAQEGTSRHAPEPSGTTCPSWMHGKPQKHGDRRATHASFLVHSALADICFPGVVCLRNAWVNKRDVQPLQEPTIHSDAWKTSRGCCPSHKKNVGSGQRLDLPRPCTPAAVVESSADDERCIDEGVLQSRYLLHEMVFAFSDLLPRRCVSFNLFQTIRMVCLEDSCKVRESASLPVAGVVGGRCACVFGDTCPCIVSGNSLCASASSTAVFQSIPNSCKWQFCPFRIREHSFNRLSTPVLVHTTVVTTLRAHPVARIIASRALTADLLAGLIVSSQRVSPVVVAA